MTNKQQAPVGQTYHEVLADHRTNLPRVHQRAIDNAIGEHSAAIERIKHLEAENAALIQDVAKLTRKLHQREETPPKRVSLRERVGPITNGQSRVR